MIVNEYKKDLFKVDSANYLVHCISSDFALGAGIAKLFKQRGVKQYLIDHYESKWNGIGYALYAPIDGYAGVYNLVTKERYYNKPTYATLREALEDLKSRIPKECKIAMPYIGCGLDKLEWNNVKDIILDVFGDTDIEITICSL